jgi:hypothetical protein
MSLCGPIPCGRRHPFSLLTMRALASQRVFHSSGFYSGLPWGHRAAFDAVFSVPKTDGPKADSKCGEAMTTPCMAKRVQGVSLPQLLCWIADGCRQVCTLVWGHMACLPVLVSLLFAYLWPSVWCRHRGRPMVCASSAQHTAAPSPVLRVCQHVPCWQPAQRLQQPPRGLPAEVAGKCANHQRLKWHRCPSEQYIGCKALGCGPRVAVRGVCIRCVICAATGGRHLPCLAHCSARHRLAVVVTGWRHSSCQCAYAGRSSRFICCRGIPPFLICLLCAPQGCPKVTLGTPRWHCMACVLLRPVGPWGKAARPSLHLHVSKNDVLLAVAVKHCGAPRQGVCSFHAGGG